MDELQVQICPDHPSSPDLFAKVLINGNIVPEPDYWLNIDTFFSAVGNRASEIEFIGTCGVANCWANDQPQVKKERTFKTDIYALSDPEQQKPNKKQPTEVKSSSSSHPLPTRAHVECSESVGALT